MGYSTPVRRRLVAAIISVAVLALLGASFVSRAGAQSEPGPPMLQPLFDLFGPNDGDAEPQDAQPESEPQPQPTPQPGPLPFPPQPQPQPEPTPSPTPTPEETPAPQPAPQEQPPQQGRPQSPPPPQQEHAEPKPAPAPDNGARFRAQPMQPFPTVRIKGHLVRGGARITMLSVRAPARTRVAVSCRGRGCPTRSSRAVIAGGGVRIRAFERFLPAGVRLAIRVTSPGRLGKHTYIRIRRDRVPLRRDACLTPGGSRPVSCSG